MLFKITLTNTHHFFFSAISWLKVFISKSAHRGGRIPFALFRVAGLEGAGTGTVRFCGARAAGRGAGNGTVCARGGAFGGKAFGGARVAGGGRSGTFGGAGGGGGRGAAGG
jgi:hypothetical protein